MRADYPLTRLSWTYAAPVVPWKVGSLQEKIAAEMDVMLNGIGAYSDASAALFSSNNRDTSTPNVSYNSGLWCAGLIDLSPISVITYGRSDDRFPVILVHEHFVYAAAHIRGSGPYVFKREDGGYETRTVLGWFAFPTLSFPPSSIVTRDASIGLLSAPITTIEPAKLLPDYWATYFPPPTKAVGETGFSRVPMHYLPALCRRARTSSGGDFARIMVIAATESYDHNRDYRDIAEVSPVTAYMYSGEGLTVAAHSQHVGWYDTVIGGDSGSPFFYPYNGKMLLLGAHYTAGGGPGIAQSYGGLEGGMNSLATTHGIPGAGEFSLNKIDLSGFTSYA